MGTCPAFVSETSDSALTLSSNAWTWGDVHEGKTKVAFKVRHSVTDPAGTYVDWPFTITLHNPCWDDAATRTTTAVDIPFIVEADGSTAAMTSTANTVTWANTATETDCAQTSELQILGADNQWTAIGSSDISSYAWMSTTTGSDLTAGQIKVQVEDITANGAIYRAQPVTYELRWVNNSPRSYSTTSTLYDYFDVTISYECATDVLTKSATDIGVWAYELGTTPAAVKKHIPTHSVAGCALAMVCEQNDPTAVGWQAIDDPPFTTCDTTTGISLIYETGDAGFDDVRPSATRDYRVTYTSTYSTVADDAGRVVTDYF